MKFALAALAGVLLAVVPALAAGKGSSKIAADFRKQGESSRKAIESARDQLQKTIAAYDMLLGSDEKKVPASQKQLIAEIESMGKIVEDIRKQVTSFRAVAEKFFAAWEEQLHEIQTEGIRAASERRLTAAKAVFKNMSENLTGAGEAYRPMIVSLKEQATLIGQDVSGETMAILNDVAPEIHSQADQVLASIEKSLSKEVTNESEMDTIIEEEEAEAGDAEGGAAEAGDAEDEDGEAGDSEEPARQGAGTATSDAVG